MGIAGILICHPLPGEYAILIPEGLDMPDMMTYCTGSCGSWKASFRHPGVVFHR